MSDKRLQETEALLHKAAAFIKRELGQHGQEMTSEIYHFLTDGKPEWDGLATAFFTRPYGSAAPTDEEIRLEWVAKKDEVPVSMRFMFNGVKGFEDWSKS